MDNTQEIIIRAKSIKKLVMFSILEAFISAVVVFAVLFILKGQKLEKNIIAYALTCVIVFIIVLFFALLKMLFQARVKYIKVKKELAEIGLRLANLEIKVNWDDIDSVKKLRIKDNVKTNIFLKNGTKIPVWSTAFHKKDWKSWENILIEHKFIRPVD